MDTFNDGIARRIRLICARERINVPEFARRCRLSETSAYHWARGEYAPGSYGIYVIGKTFDVSADWLMGLSAEERRNNHV